MTRYRNNFTKFRYQCAIHLRLPLVALFQLHTTLSLLSRDREVKELAISTLVPKPALLDEL